MRKTRISVTEASRNFADCVNRVRYQDATFVLTKNKATVAELKPSSENTCTGPQLAAALAKVRLSPSERQAWQTDLEEARNFLVPPIDKWK